MKFLLDTNICIYFFKGQFDLVNKISAVVNNMTMVTRNVKEFERLENIKIENWIDGSH